MFAREPVLKSHLSRSRACQSPELIARYEEGERRDENSNDISRDEILQVNNNHAKAFE